ncbi:MAG TPA: N-acetylneuraminate synthase [Candidatus Limnocylindrales bacterium]
MPTEGSLRPILFLIPARAGSVRLPRKNLELVDGIPLVGRAARRARRAAAHVPGGPHAVVCSTDSEAIAEVAHDWGAAVPFLRPAELSDASATSADVAIHALGQLGGDGDPERFRAVVLVQPTSALATWHSLVKAIEAFDRTGRPVTTVHPTHPGGWHVEGREALARVDVDDAARVLDGAAYVVAPADLERTGTFTPDGALAIEIDPFEGIDVDTSADLEIARAASSGRLVAPIEVGGRSIGPGRPCFVIAEAGINHNGDLALAHRLVDAAADAGADAVKFQTFSAARLAAAQAPLAAYQQAAGSSDQHELLSRLELSADDHVELQSHAADRNIAFLSSPFDEESADLLERLDVPAFKVPSGELTNGPYLAHLAGKGRPMLVSTGMATMVEVAEAVDAIADAGDPPLALFHCVSSYPAAAEDANLRAIATLRRAFGTPTGWSDHTPGVDIALAAVAIGADLVEKHMTLDRTLPGPDHRASLEPSELAALVHGIRGVEAALGSGRKEPVAAERETADVSRKSLHWARDLPSGASVGADDLVALRPGTGIAPSRRDGVIGARLSRNVRAGSVVQLDDIEPKVPA